jgi:hypothetical protein
MSEAEIRQYAIERLNIETDADKKLFLEVVAQLQNEGVVTTDDVFVVIKATVDLTKEILEKGRA